MKKIGMSKYKKNTDPMYTLIKNQYSKDLQKNIPISAVSKSGIFQIEPDKKGPILFDKVYRFTDINYSLLDDSEKKVTLEKWIEILKSMKMSYKIIVTGIPKKEKRLEEDNKMFAIHDGPIFQVTNDALNNHIQNSYVAGSNELERGYYFVISCAKETVEEVVMFYESFDKVVFPLFQTLGSELKGLDGTERLELLHSIYRQKSESEFRCNWDVLSASRDYFKNEISPMTMQVTDSSIQIDDRYGSVLLARSYPEGLEDGFITRLTTEVNFPFVITMDMSSVSKQETKEYCQRKLMNIEGSLDRQQQQNNKRGAFHADPSWDKRMEKEEVVELLDDFHNGNDVMAFVSFLVFVEGSSKEELESRVERIKQQASGLDVELEVFQYQQLEAFNTVLPTATRQVNVMRQVMIKSMRAFCPFDIADLNTKGQHRFFYGVNHRSRRMIFADKQELKNGNGFVYAPPGSGKSFFVKHEIVQVLNYTNDDVLILDPASEYEDICELYGGQFINFTSATDTHINPLWIPDEVYEDVTLRQEFIADKGIFMQRLFVFIKKSSLKGNEATYVDRSVRRMYESVFDDYDNQDIMNEPTFKEYQKSLEKEEKAGDLLDAFELYVSGSSNVFAHKSNVDINNRMVVFGIRNLGETMRKPSMLIITELMTTRLTYNKNRNRATRVFGDELHVVFDDDDFVLAWEKLWKVARKDGGFATGITQNIADSTLSKQARTMVSNSEVLVILSLSKADRLDLPDIIDLSEQELKFLEGKDKGIGLMKFGNTKVVFDARIAKDNPLYWMFTTDPKEFEEKKAHLSRMRQEIRIREEERIDEERRREEQRREMALESLRKLEESLSKRGA